MHRFTNILFSPLGEKGNAAAVRRLGELATGNDARLTLFGVISEPSGLQRLLHGTELFADIQQTERDVMATRLRRWEAKAGSCDVDSAIEVGSQAIAIINRVVTEGHDLLVVTTDEDREDHATIRRLLRKCPCPVWIIRPTRARTQRVLAAVNPDPEEAQLNHTILEISASMVERFGGELHLVHAWQLYGEDTLRSSAFIRTTPAELDHMLEQEQVSHARALTDLLMDAGLRESPWQIHLDKGPPEAVVARVIAKSRINLLVMGTLARTGIPGILIGNTAERILDDLRCSVVAVKPPSFASPLAPPGK